MLKNKSVSFILFLWVLIFPLFLSAQQKIPKSAVATLNKLSESFENLVEQAGPAVVQIFASGYGPGDAQTTASLLAPQRSSGSGVILDPRGYIVTNAHVVAGAEQIEVSLLSKFETDYKSNSILKPRGKRVPASVVGIDRETDLAVIRIEEQGCPYLELGDSDLLRQGQVVLAFGSPLGLENSVSMGVVSSVARQLEAESPMVYIQTDAPINPGNSGGPLLDTNGNVVGINTLMFSQSGGNEGLGFAAPSNIVANVYRQIVANGKVRRGEIGVDAQTITPVLAEGLGLPQNWGVVLADVFPGSQAHKAGLQVGDVVFALDDKLMENGRQFDVNLYRRAVGETVTLEVLRGSERLRIDVEVIERDDDPYRFSEMVSPENNLIPELGILALDIDRRLERRLPPLRKQFGVLVAAISAEAYFESGMFVPGDVIFMLNNRDITGLQGLRTALSEVEAGSAIVVQVQRRSKLRYIALQKAAN